MSRSKKYNTGLALRRAVADYFSSISRVREIMEERNTGEKDAYGHFVKEWVPVRNGKGEVMTEREYIIPPTVGGLCDYLGISRVTWSKYCDKAQNPQFAEITEWAREQMLAWREKELMIRPGRDLTGVLFDLKVNYGIREDPLGSDDGGGVQIIDDL